MKNDHKSISFQKRAENLVDKMNPEWDKAIALISGTIKELSEHDLKSAIAASIITPLGYVQAIYKGYGKQKFLSDIHDLVEKGELPGKFWEDDLTRKTFLDITNIIDLENPSIDKVEAMIALLIKVADTKENEKKRYAISIHLDTLRQLDSVEFQIVMSSYRLRKNGRADQKSPTHKSSWREYIMEETGWDKNMVYEIERREQHLVDLRIIDSHPGVVDHNSLTKTSNCRLTGLGIKIGDIVTAKVASKSEE